jgi:uncharacterized protein YidB (DUF937 family)
MSLLDILNSVTGGGAPTGQSAPAEGTSPIAKALIGLVTMYAMKSMQQTGATQPAGGSGLPGGLGDLLGGLLGGGGTGGGAAGGGGGGGGLGDLLGGLLGGGSAGAALNGGLGDLIKQFQQSGQGDVAGSWVGSGPNKAISPSDLAGALGSDTIETLARQTGMRRDELLAGLSQHLPGFVDQLTPNGRLPTAAEAARLL